MNHDFGSFTGLDAFFAGLFLAGCDCGLAQDFSFLALLIVSDGLDMPVFFRYFQCSLTLDFCQFFFLGLLVEFYLPIFLSFFQIQISLNVGQFLFFCFGN